MHTQLVIDCEVHHAYYSQYSLSLPAGKDRTILTAVCHLWPEYADIDCSMQV
ncbi:hypothetical protein UUU_03220 (plasmid) [Klebsiella pneumoniae subsp. pneumoniae DSM 30104 = JCM 1662 = NBRC 14940]|nr:hypothetical protein UUU_03220 [Klebsiella pneumoniae subsp. pneumoniae DSM 30104 = JCM 1662 = NBRC 14940]